MAKFRDGLVYLCLAGLIVLPTGCSEDTTSLPNPAAVTLAIVDEPSISYDETNGTTNVVIEFVARDEHSVPLTADNVEVTMTLDNEPIDSEALLEEDSEALASNLHLSLVLDTSYSMLRHDPPAFQPMLKAARRTVQEGRNVYTGRPGEFTWSMYWFNDLIYHPIETWPEFVIESIPSPKQGAFTKLYAATRQALDAAIADYEVDGTDRDRYIVVVFSDGADNYSWFGNSEISGTASIANDYDYNFVGSEPVTKADVLDAIRSHPSLQVHVMGLGSEVNDDDLRSLAQAGRGGYFKNLDPAQVNALFDRVILEFTTIQSQGVTLPIPPGQYRFRIKVRRTDADAETSYTFNFHGGDFSARLLD